MDAPIVLEVGPVAVLRAGGAEPPRAMVAAALECVDDRVALVGEHPVRVDDLLRSLIARALGERCQHVVVVHPSSWPVPRVDRVLRAASSSADRVTSMTRTQFAGPAAVVVEIGVGSAAVCAGGSVTAVARDDVEAIAATAARLAGDRRAVVIDVPPGLPGGEITAAAIRVALGQPGLAGAEAEIATPPPTRRRRITLGPRLIGAIVLVSVSAVFIAIRPHAAPPVPTATPAAVTSTMVEGRVAVVIPDGWIVERLTGGAGSRRVRVGPPGDPDRALHITQSYVPGTTLAETREVLGRAVAVQLDGVFTDFDRDEVAGRPAITYRENRPPRVVDWAVLLDGSTRIAIGCQSRAGATEGIAAACDQAIRSARELEGTAGPS